MKKCYKSLQSASLFDQSNTLEELSSLQNPLERLSLVIDFEIFRESLESLLYAQASKNNAGARAFDVVLMFKVLLLQRFYNLSDEATEYQIKDRYSFRSFLGIQNVDDVPDSRTIWNFRQKLKLVDGTRKLFDCFNSYLKEKGLFFKEGLIVDASFVISPRPSNTKKEASIIKQGKGGELWKDKPHKKSQKDVDARWARKGGQLFYGYKNHAKVDQKSKLILSYIVTDAAVHDQQAVRFLLDENDKKQKLYADKAYKGLGCLLKRKEVINCILEKAERSHPLTPTQKENNALKSKIRSRIEHVFGFMEGAMKGLVCRTVGIERARETVGFINLCYNIFRYEQILRYQLCAEKEK